MIVLIHWVGQVVSDNEKTVRYRSGGGGNSKAYTFYRSSVANTIRSARPGLVLERPGLFVQFSLEGHHDAQNCLKGLLDGIQDSGLVVDDRHISPITLLPTVKHKRREQDEAWLGFWGSE